MASLEDGVKTRLYVQLILEGYSCTVQLYVQLLYCTGTGRMLDVLQEIGTATTWMRILPINLCTMQDRYYNMMGIRSSGKRWGTELINKVLRATLQLWLQRNEIVHAQTKEGLKGVEREALIIKKEDELAKGIGGLQPEDFYLLDTNMENLKGEPIESVRGWLCNAMIARRDLKGAQEEGLKDRGIISHHQPKLTGREMKKYLDYRSIHRNE